MQWTHWRTRFESRRDRDLPIIDDTPEIPADLRAPLAASLARLQLAETGEGRIVADLRRRAAAWNLCPDYLEAMRLFIAEEGRHAAILGTAVRALGGQPLRRTWSADGFGRLRRLAGPGPELLVLLAAEVAALGFYGMLVEHLHPGPLRAALHEIACDEAVHLRFHVEFLRTTLPSPLRRRALVTPWSAMAVLAGLVVVADHRTTLARLGTSRRAVLARVHELVTDTAEGITGELPSSRKRSAVLATFGGSSPLTARAQAPSP